MTKPLLSLSSSMEQSLFAIATVDLVAIINFFCISLLYFLSFKQIAWLIALLLIEQRYLASLNSIWKYLIPFEKTYAGVLFISSWEPTRVSVNKNVLRFQFSWTKFLMKHFDVCQHPFRSLISSSKSNALVFWMNLESMFAAYMVFGSVAVNATSNWPSFYLLNLLNFSFWTNSLTNEDSLMVLMNLCSKEIRHFPHIFHLKINFLHFTFKFLHKSKVVAVTKRLSRYKEIRIRSLPGCFTCRVGSLMLSVETELQQITIFCYNKL